MCPHTKQLVRKRLNIIAGQIKGLIAMVEREEYCIDVITQAGAIKQALSSFEDAMLLNHLSTHVVEQMASGKKNKAIAEIMTIYKLSKNRK